MSTVTTASLLAIALFFSSAHAQETVTERRIPRRATVEATQVVTGDYFAIGDMVEISGTIHGDLYASGGQIVIDGRVDGDVLVAGGRVTIRGIVSQDVRAAGGNVTISGRIGRNLTVAGGNVELMPSAAVQGGVVAAAGSLDLGAPIGGSARVAAGNLILSSRVGGDVKAAVGTLRITSRADLQGDVSYWSRREAAVSEGARLRGKIARSIPPELPRVFPAAIVIWLVVVSASFASTLVLGLLSIRFLPRFHQSVVSTLRERPLASLGIGFVTAVVLPVACFLLFMTWLGLPLALLVLAAFFILLYWARIYVIGRIGETIIGRLRPGSGQVSAFIVGLLIYYLLVVIPFVAWLVVPLVMLFGVGAELIARRNFYLSARRQELL